jgi:hypothetical protein
MSVIGSNAPSSTYFSVDRRRWWFTKFIPTQDMTINELWCYCYGGSTTIRYVSSIQMAITSNVWNYTTHYYPYINNCYRSIPDTEMIQPYWAWRGGTTVGVATLYAGITYNFWISGNGFSDSSQSRIGYVVGASNTHGVSFVSSYWYDHSPPNYNLNYLPSMYGGGEYISPPGPALKIEGTTPGKLEYTSWSNINTVR